VSALRDTQVRMLAALRHGGDANPTWLRPGPGLGPARRLQIYRNNHFETLTNAMFAVYPVLAQLVSESFFRRLARGYIAEHPSRSGNVQRFGGRLAAYVARLPAAAGLPYLRDVAALEWACHEVYHAAADIVLAPLALLEVPAAEQPRLRLRLQRSSRLIASRFPILKIWQAHQTAAGPASGPISLEDGAVRLLVTQRDLDVEFCVLATAEDRWLRALSSGATLAEASATALRIDAAFNLAGVLTRHLALGSFAASSIAAVPA
jgi:hypothetical protein